MPSELGQRHFNLHGYLLKKKLEDALHYAASKLGLIGGAPTSPCGQLEKESHEFELESHKSNQFRQSNGFMSESLDP